MPYEILTPPRIIVGPGSVSKLGECVAGVGRRALVVTGRRSLRRAGITQQILGRLAAAGIEASLFDEVEPEPSCATVDRVRDALRRGGCDVVVGAGGGSALDAAKVAAGLAEEEPPTVEFWLERATVVRRGVPFVSVPTLSGTGAEVTRNGVITLPAGGGQSQTAGQSPVSRKRSIRDDSFVARLVIVDPYLTLSTPPRQTAHAGVDALTQAIESFTSRHANPVTDAWAIEAVLRLKDSVPAAVRNGSDLAARTDVAVGGLLSGLALSNARLGLVHGLAHPLGARYGIPHGLVCGVLMPRVIRFNRAASPEKFARLDAAAGGDAADFLDAFLHVLDLPADLGAFGVKPEDFPAIIEETLASGSTKANPRTVTPEACMEILRDLI